MLTREQLVKICHELLAFYGDERSYFEQPTLSGYKPPPVMLDQGKRIQELLKELEEDCSDSKGAYP